MNVTSANEPEVTPKMDDSIAAIARMQAPALHRSG